MLQPHWWTSARDRGDPLACVLIDCAGLEQGASDLPRAAFSELDCLFTGDLREELADVSGYLARLASWNDAVCEAVVGLLKRQVALILLFHDSATSDAAEDSASSNGPEFSTLHRHFRKFNVVYGPEGKPLFFRYYDPRVLTGVLKVLDAQQLGAFFGPCAAFVSVDERGSWSEVRLANGSLDVRVLPEDQA